MKQIFSLWLFIVSFTMVMATSETENHSEDFDYKGFISHHLKDSHEWHLTDLPGGKPLTMPLPVILWDGGLQVFMSSKFEHGEALVEKNGNFYKYDHGHIYKTDASGTINYDEEHHATNEKPLDFSITKNVLSIMIVCLLMFLLFSKLAKSYKDGWIPKGIGRFLEPLVIFIREEIAIPNIGEHKYRRFMGYLLTVFFFILFLNLMGMTPLGINVTGNIAVTFSLALLTYLVTQFGANKGYWKHIFWFPDVPVIMKIALIPLEILGTLTKPFALMIRLYANMTAGHIVLMTLLSLIFIFKNAFAGAAFFSLSLAISILELFVAFLQAYVFTMLSSLFIGMAVADHDDH